MNILLLEYALRLLQRSLFKSLSILVMMVVIVWLLASLFFIANAIKYELSLSTDSVPDIIVQKQRAGMPATMDEGSALEVLEIPGVSGATPRVWGYYYFAPADLYFTLMGVDEFDVGEREILQSAVKNSSFNENSIIVGEGVLELLEKSYYKEYFNFITDKGDVQKMHIAGTFHSATRLESNDLIVMQKERLKKIFGFKESEITDLAISVTNKTEIPTIALKLTQNYPNHRVITKEDIKVSYENIFDYKSGLFLALFIVAFATFFIIVYDVLMGMNSSQRREIGILKAVGWRVEDILKVKLYESLLLSLFAYLLGVFLAFCFVYLFGAPLLSNLFLGHQGIKPPLEILFVFDMQTLFLLFLLSVPPYVGATIIPAWRVATLDADEVMR